jgi:hypothetical protein
MQDANGDYVFGQGEANFWVNQAQGVAQTVQTRLALWEGAWFLDNTVGTPWSQEILGYSTQALRDLAIKTIILDTDDVTSISAYSSTFGPAARQFTVSATIMTTFGPATVNFPPTPTS